MYVCNVSFEGALVHSPPLDHSLILKPHELKLKMILEQDRGKNSSYGVWTDT